MLYIHDKAKTLFEETSAGKQKNKKIKLITFSTTQTSDTAHTHFIAPKGKMPAHFVLDGSAIVKYNYNTTNIFPVNTKWNHRSKLIVEQTLLEAPEEISGHIEITYKPLEHKHYDKTQKPTSIMIYYAETPIDTFYIDLGMEEKEVAYHYLIDDTSCYEVVSPLFECNEANQIHIVMLGKNNRYDVFDRTAKLVMQLFRTHTLETYELMTDASHIYPVASSYAQSVNERMRVAQADGGTSEEMIHSMIKDDANPGDHIIHIKLLYQSDSDFPQKEKALIMFLAEYLFYFNLSTSSLWRVGDLFSGTYAVHYYNRKEDFYKLIASVEEVLLQLQKGSQQIEIQSTGLPEYDKDGDLISHSYTTDNRNIMNTTYFLTNSQKSINQDYDSTTIGGNVEMRSKFEDGAGAFSETMQFSSHYYEPVYPDLTVPPRNSTMLYNKGLLSPRDILKEMDQPVKPVIGKIPNAFDPYPIDDKIAQLEKHAPIVTLEYEDAGDVKDNMFAYMNNRFGNTEKRLVRLENILATVLRYQGRLASRLTINCQYFGGTSPFSKYAAIRCLNDDLTTDAMTCTLDQCLNCSRYEPVLGQFYEITGDSPGMAQVYDDIQASLMTKEEFAKFNNLTAYHEPLDKTKEDLTKLHLKDENEKAYDELLDEANNFVMNWTETPYHEQSPHINHYVYNPYTIYSEKFERLSNQNIYEDGWQAQAQLKFKREQHSLNSLGGGNFNPYSSDVDGLNGLYTINDYEIGDDDKRLLIIDACNASVKLGASEHFLYTFGAKIKEQYMTLDPASLYHKVTLNEPVNDFTSGRGDDDLSHLAVYFDCSSFASYIYRYAGVLTQSFTTTSLKNYYGFDVIPNNHTPILEQLTKAYPGDLLLYKGHVTIYAGEDYQYEASTDKNKPNSQQICKSKIQNRNDFIGIYQHSSLSKASIKNKTDVRIDSTLDAFITVQLGKNVGRDTNGDGYVDLIKDADWSYDRDLLGSYIDPKKRLTPELKMQFSSIRNLTTPGIITAEMIDDFLLRKGGSAIKKIKGLKVDNNYDPVRDLNDNLVWEEKFAFPRGDVWMRAAERSGLNPLFLMAHCAGETGWCCMSNWTNYSGDFMAKKSDDYLFNAFGIWCYDSEYHPKDPSLHRVTAKRETEANKWFSLEKSVVEGAIWIAENYIGDANVSKYGRRDTAYFMKWHFGRLIPGQNPDANPATMQYATDMSWADQRAKNIYDALKASPVGREEAIKHFDYYIPVFKE